MKRILFFALKEDLLPVFEKVESTFSLKYTRTGQFFESNLPFLGHGSEIPNLGRASSESSISCTTYLVVDSAARVNMRPIKQLDGAEHFSADQLFNPDSVTFTAGGIWTPDMMLHGRLATASDSDRSKELMKLFNSAFSKQFKKVKAYWVGPGAYAFLGTGARLTVSAQSPRDFDLIS